MGINIFFKFLNAESIYFAYKVLLCTLISTGVPYHLNMCANLMCFYLMCASFHYFFFHCDEPFLLILHSVSPSHDCVSFILGFFPVKHSVTTIIFFTYLFIRKTKCDV